MANLLKGIRHIWYVCRTNSIYCSRLPPHVRYFGPRKDYYDGPIYCFGFWWFHFYLTE